MSTRLIDTFFSRIGAAALAAMASVSLSMSFSTAHAQTAPATNALPTGAQVVAGSATVAQGGSAAAPVMTVQQNTERAIVNWNTFNIGRDASVVFQQPGSSSVILNRVLDTNPSQIFGNLQSNGQVFLMNPSGVWFGPGSSVDVGALMATTHSISNADFMAGNYRFERNGATGKIVNEGSIEAKLGGYIALLAPEVRNEGVLLAKSGTIALAAGETVTMNVNPATSQIDLLVSPSTVDALIENKKIVKAPEGRVIMSAQAYNELASGVIRNSGEISAAGITKVGGKITLGASTEIANSGVIDASSLVADGGGVSLDANKVTHSGVITVAGGAANSATGSTAEAALPAKGGEVSIAGNSIYIEGAAKIDATGTHGGGTVLVGGDWQGSGSLRQAIQTVMDKDAVIDASAIVKGNGGKIVLWSDVRNANSITTVNGSLFAKAGEHGGDGGQIETSGYQLTIDDITINAGSSVGTAGLWLIDPFDYNISAANATAIGNALNTTNVTVTTTVQNTSYGSSTTSSDQGNITLNAGIAKTATSGTTTLTLQANRYITTQYNTISSAPGGPLNVIFWADSDGNNDAGIGVIGAITTNGGHLWVGGGSASTTWNGLTVPNGPAVSNLTGNWNPLALGSAISTGGGDVMLWSGVNYGGGTGPTMNFYTEGSASVNAGSGNITIRARRFDFGNNNLAYGGFTSLPLTTTGTIKILPDTDGGSFGMGIDSRWFDITRATPSGYQFGAAGNTGAFTVGAGLTINGNIDIYGGEISLAAALNSTSAAGRISLNSSAGNTLKTITTVNAALLTATGGITINADKYAWSAGNVRLDTSGVVTIQPTSTSFTYATNTNWFTYNVNRTMAGLNFGKAGNTSVIDIESAISAAGPINIYGGPINTNYGLSTTAAGAGILLKSTEYITVGIGPAISLQTNNGNITLWADSDGDNYGAIRIRENATFNSANGATSQSTGGGAITLAGGTTADANGLPTGYAHSMGTGNWGSTPASGVQLGAYTANFGSGFGNSIRFYSGGGNILIKGKSTAGVPGISWFGSNSATSVQVIDAGSGTITLDGQATNGHGIELCYYGGTTCATMTSSSSATEAISITGATTTNVASSGYQGSVTLIASGTGGISVSASNHSASTSRSLYSTGLNLYALIGPIAISGTGGTGLMLGGTWGKGTLSGSTSNITVTGDAINWSSTTINTTGSLTIRPYATSFSSALSWPLSNVTFSNTLTGLTLGKTGNVADITVGSTPVVNGPISLMGRNITLNAPLSLTNATTGDLSIMASGQLSGSGNISLTGARTATISVGSASTYAGNISGASGLLVKQGAGTLILTGTNTYGGTTTISAGSLQIGAGSTTGTLGYGEVINNGSLIFNRSDTYVVSNLISGTGSVLKQGAGLTGLTAANTYSGGTTLLAGSLGVYNNTALSSGTVTVASGASNASLLFGRAVTSFGNNLMLNGNVTFDLDTSVEYLLVAGGGGGGAWVGGGGGGGGALAGSTELNGSSYDISVGTGGLGMIYDAVSIVRTPTVGGNSTAFGLTALGGGYGGIFSGFNASTGGSGGGQGGNQAAASGTPGQGYAGGVGNGSASYGYVAGGGGGAGGVGGSWTATRAGDGGIGLATMIRGVLEYFGGGGGGGVHSSGGAAAGLGGLGGGGNGVVASTTPAGSGLVNTGGGGGGAGLVNNQRSQGGDGGTGIVIARYIGSSAGSGGAMAPGTSLASGYTLHTFTTTGSNTLTFHAIAVNVTGNITGTGSLTTNATGGTMTFSGNNSYSGATAISGGVVQANHVNALGNNSALTMSNIAGTQLQLLKNLSIGSLAGGGTSGGNIALGSYALTLGGNNTSTSYAGVISGSGTLTKTGTGTQILSSAQTYTGDTTISGGTLQLGNGTAAATLASANIINNSNLALSFGVDATVSNNISGTGNLQITGVPMTLFSANLTTTAQTIATNTTVAEVLYRLSGGRMSGTAVTAGIMPRETGAYVKSFDPLTNSATLQFQFYDMGYTKTIFVKLTQSGSNVQAVIDTSGAYVNGTAYTVPNILGTDMSSGYTYTMPLATTEDGGGYGLDRLYIASKITLTGNNTYTGTTTINNTTTTVNTGINQYSATAPGTLQFNAGIPSSGSIANSGVLIFNGSTAQSSSMVMSGSGVLIKNGSNTLTLTGNQTYTGATVVNAGTLQFGTGGTTGLMASSSSLFLPYASATLTLNRSDNLSLSNAIRGVGTFTKLASNDLTLTASNLRAVFDIEGGNLIAQNDSPSISGSTFYGPGNLILQSASNSFSSAYTLTGFTLNSDLGGLTVGKTTNTVDVTLSSATTISGPITVYGGNITLSANLNTAASTTGNVLLKGTGNINLGSSRSITTGGGSVTLWSDSDGNGTGYVQMLSNSSVTTGSGAITLGGGSNILTGYARGEATRDQETEPTHTLYIAGVHLRSGARLTSTSGDITLRGQNVGGSPAAMSFGVFGTNATVDAGTGKIAMTGYVTGTANINAQGISSYSPWTLRSANTTAQAITLTGDASGVTGGSGSLGINFNGLIEATGIGGGITLYGKGGAVNGDCGLCLTGSALARSGPITLIGETNWNYALSLSGPTLGAKAGTNVTSSSSNIIFKTNAVNIGSGTTVTTTGTFSLLPLDGATSFPLTQSVFNLGLASTVSGLTIGTATNTSGITLGSAFNIAGPVTVYGGNILASANITATGGNILLDADTGTTLAQSTHGIELGTGVSIKTLTSGDITLLGRSGSGACASPSCRGIYAATRGTIDAAGNVSMTGLSFTSGTSGRGIDLFGVAVNAGGSVSMTGQHAPGASYAISFAPSSTTQSTVTAGTGIRLETLNNGTGTIAFDSSASLNGGSGDIVLSSAMLDLRGTSKTFTTTGKITIQPDADEASFGAALSTQYLNVSSTSTGLTIGKETNTSDITFGAATTMAGFITAYGNNINVNAHLNTSGGNANGDILLKAAGNITQAAGVSVTTNGGDVIYWANRSGLTSGAAVLLREGASVSTGGGHLWMGGGSGSTTWNGLTVGNGYAVAGTTLTGASCSNCTITAGISLEAASLQTSGGSISLRGRSNMAGNGIATVGNTLIDAGSGKLLLEAASTGSLGLVPSLHYQIRTGGARLTLRSSSAAADAIVLEGTSTAGEGIYASPMLIEASNGGGVRLTGSTTVAGSAGINFGYSTFAAAIDILANSGAVTINGGSGITVASATTLTVGLKAGSTITASSSDISLVADTMSLRGTVASSGSLTLRPNSTSATIGLGSATGNLTLAASLFSGASRIFTDGFSGITIGATNGGAITVGGAVAFTDSATLLSSGNITLNSGASVSSSQASGTLAIAAGGNFVNNAGASAVSTTDAGANDRWIVYSSSSATATFGPTSSSVLASGNGAVWGQTYSTLAPSSVASGNRYVFGNSPSVTAQTTNQTKTYGDTPNLSSALSITMGAASSSAYTAPTVAEVFSTLPTVTSSGAAASATVAGGPYAITASGGVINSGFTVTFSNTGTLTVQPKALTLTSVSVANKVYDSTNVATLSGLLSGVLFSDAVDVSLTGTFASVNAGNGIAVTSTSTLTGTKAGNYSLTQPAGLTANITKKTLTVTAQDDAKFAGLADATGYAGVLYSGFAGSDTATSLSTAPTVTRSNSSANIAGTYSSVLVPAGGVSNNYEFSYVNGNYTIVPANQMLVRLGAVTNTYGSTPTYSVTEAKYMLPNSGIVDLLATGSATITGNQITVRDAANASATFTVLPTNGSNSTSGWLKAGTYTLGATNITTTNGANFSNTVSLVGNQQVTARALTPSLTISKEYDGSVTIALFSLTPGGIISGDAVLLDGSGTYANKNAGTGKSYTLNGLTLSGTDAANYSLASSTLNGTNGTITQRALTVSGISANDKVYDGTTTATLNYTGVTYSGLVAGDAFAATATGTFSSANAGARTVTLSSPVYTGADAGNYAITMQASTSATITAKSLNLSGLTASNKVYDGSVTAAISSYGTLSGVVGSDAVSLVTSSASASFANKNVGTGKTVTLLASSLSLSGAAAANYTISSDQTTTADITAKPITVSGITASDKVYDGGTSATVSTGSAVFNGMVAGDVLTMSVTGSFADKSVSWLNGVLNGTVITKTVTLSSSFSGADLANYTITPQGSTTATITPKALTVSGLVADSRVYDGGVVATVTNTNVLLSGLLANDVVSVTATGTFADKNVGTGKTVTLTSTYTGADVGNYAITSQASSSANITPKTLTISGITAADKTYDGDNLATISTAAAVRTGLVNGDVVSISASGTFSDENVANGKTVTLSSSYSGADVNNYTITSQATTTANITPLDVTLSGSTGLQKVYDTSTALPAGVTGYGGLSSASASVLANDIAINGGLGITGAPVFDSANAGNRIVQQGSVALSGTRAGNYRLVWANGSGTIDKAPLTIAANDDAKFYSEDDTAGYNSVRYSGFVGGQTATTAGVFTGTLAITRDRTGLSGAAAQDSAGTYTNKLVASGLNAANYDITYVPGTYTIVPVGELLVKVQNQTTTYGSAPNYTITAARYMAEDPNNASAFVVTDLLAAGYVSVAGSSVTVTDGLTPKAMFELGAAGGQFSSAGHLNAGGWQLAATTVFNASPDFSSKINVVGSWQVNQKGVTVNPSGVTKVYDGSTLMSNLALAPVGLVDPLTGTTDQVSVTGTGNFADKNVSAQADKTYTLSSLTLAGVTANNVTINDSANYFLSNGSTYIGSNGQITPRTLTVTYGGVNKVYNGDATATVTTADDRVSGDTLSVLRTANFTDKNAATGKTVNVTSVSLSGTDAGNYVVAATGSTTADITPRTLTVNYAGVNKVYDGDNSASVTTTDDRVAGDVFGVLRSAAFGDKNVGGGKTVSVTGVSLDGTDAGNYSVAATGSTTANITPRTLTITFAGVTKVYDGGIVANVTTTDDRVAGDVLDIARVAAFVDKNVGTGKQVSVSGVSLSGTDADNYAVASTGATTGDITPRTLTVIYGGVNKVYDGDTVASVTTSDNRVAGDVLDVLRTANFSDKNAATGKTVNVTGVSLSGTDAANYSVASTGSATADITQRVLTVNYTGVDRVYNGGVVATVTTTDDRVAGDVLDIARSAAFSDKNVGAGKTVTVSGVSLSGTDAGNYSVAAGGATAAEITPRTLIITFGGVNKVYDGGTVASVTTSDDRVLNDVLSIARTAAFSDKNVADGKTVSVTGVSLSGTDADNYVVATTGTTTANIAPRSLTPVFGAISKIYDGSTDAQVTSTDDRLVNDVLTVARTATFDDRHVGTGKTVTIGGLSLTGTDANNYALTITGATVTSRIDQAASTTWTGGGASSDWMDADNWAGRVLPDRSNVAAVIMNANAPVTFGASAGTVSLSSLLAPNMALTQTGGSLSTSGEMSLGELQQSGGTLSVGETLTVNRGFGQTGGGTISAGQGATLTNSVGHVTIGDLSSHGPIVIINNDGGVSQLAGTTLVAREGLSVTAVQGDTPQPIVLSNAGNQISGAVVLSGSSTALRSSGPMSATITGSEGGTLQSDDTLSVAGTLTGTGSHLNLIATDVQLGVLSVGGNLSVTGPTTASGALTVGGNLSLGGAAALNGAVTVGGAIEVSGAAQLGAAVTSTGAQRWRGAVDITANVDISGAGVRFDSDLNGPHRLVLTDSGNTLISGSVGNVSAPLHFETNGAGTTTISGGLVRSSGVASLLFNTDIVVTTDTTFDATNNGLLPGGAAITFARTLNGSTANGQSVSLHAGTGGIVTVNGAIGDSKPLSTLTLLNSGGASFNGSVTTVTGVVVNDTASGQWVRFAGNLQTPQLVANPGGYHLALTGSSNAVTTAVTFQNAGQLIIGDAANDSSWFAGGLTATAPSRVTLGGTLGSTGMPMTIGDANTPITLQAATILTSQGGNLHLGGSIDGDGVAARSLTVNAAAGTVVLAKPIGAGNSLDSVTVTGSAILLDGGSVTTSGAQQYAGPVTLSMDTLLTGNTLSFTAAIDSAVGTNVGLTLVDGGATVLGGAVGNATPLGSLTVSSVSGATLDGGSVTTTGSQTYNNAVTLGANTTLTGGDITLASTVNGANTLTILDGGATVLGGAIGDGTALTSLTVSSAGGTTLNSGSVTTTGSQTFHNAITLSANTTLTGDDITLASTVNGANSLTIVDAGATVLGGAIGDGTALTSLTVSSVGGTTLNGSIVTTAGSQTFNNAITLGANTTLTGDDITLASTVNGANSLTIVDAGATVLGGAIGDGTALTSLTVSSVGGTTLNGGSVTATGSQTFNNAITLGANTTLTGSNITLASTVNGANSLTIVDAGATVLGGAIGNVNALTSLTVNSVNGTTLNGGIVTTTGSQTFNNAISLGANTTLTGDDITLASTVNGANSLTIVDAGATVLGGAIGNATPLTSLTVNSVNGATLNGGIVTTTGSQTFNNAITLGANTTLTGSNITLASTVNGANSLTIVDAGATVLGGAIGNVNALTSLTVNSVNGATLNGGIVTTTGSQTFNNAITLGANTTLSGSNITLASTVNGANSLTIVDAGATVLGGAIGNATPLTSLTVSSLNGTTLNGGSVKTSGFQIYNHAIALGVDMILMGDDITLASTVNGANSLTIVDSGATVLGGAIGNVTPLASLTVSSTDGTTLTGGSVKTSAFQIYNHAIALGMDMVLTGDDITLASTINGATSLTIVDSGATALGGAIGDGTALASLMLSATDGIALNGGIVKTSGFQTYSNAVTLGANTTLTGDDITLASTVDGAKTLTIVASGTTVLGGAMGDGTALTSLTVSSTDGIAISGGSVKTSGLQTYSNAVTLGANVTLTGNTITFASTVDGAHALSITDSGTTVLSAAVGSGQALTTMHVDTASLQFTAINTTGDLSIITAGAQQLGDLDVGGGLSVTTGSGGTGGVSQIAGKTLTVAGNAVFTADTTTQQDANLSNAGTDFRGTVAFRSARGGSWRDVSLADAAGSLAMADVAATGTVTLTSPGTVSLQSTLNAAQLDVTATGGISQTGDLQVSGAIDLTSQGNVSLNAPVTAAQLEIVSGAAITLSSTTDVTGALSLDAQGAVALGTDTQAASLSIEATGAVTQAGPLAIMGSTTINAGVGTVTLTDAANDFGGTLTLTAASAAIVDGVGGLELGDVRTTAGGLTVQSDRGAIIQAPNASILTAAGSSFTASLNGPGTGAADVLVGNPGNDFTGALTVSGATVTVVDINALDLVVTNAAGDLTVVSAGTTTITGGLVAGDMNIDVAQANLTMGGLIVGGDVSIDTNGGNISQTDVLRFAGDVSLTAGAGAIDLGSQRNYFGGTVTLDAGSTTLASSTDLIMGEVYNRGSLELSSVGNLALTKATTVQGGLTLTSGGNLNLDQASIDGDLKLNTSGGSITVGDAVVKNDFIVSSGGGDVTLGTSTASSTSGSIQTLTGKLQISAGAGDIVLGTTTAAGDLQLATTTGNVSLGTSIVGGNLSATTTSGALTLGSTAVTGSLTATTQGGAITQTAALTVTGAASFSAGGGSVSLLNADNDFTGPVSLQASIAQINDKNTLVLDQLNIGSDLIVQSHGDLTLGTGSVSGSLSVDSGNGNITQQPAGLQVDGQMDLTAGTGSIQLTSSANRFEDTVNVSGSRIDVRAASDLLIGTLTATGSAQVQSAGELTLGQIKTSRDFNASGTDGINQLASASLTIGGASSFVSAGSDVVLDQPANRFGGAVAINAQNANIFSASGLLLGDVRLQGDLRLETAGGPIEQAPGKTITVDGAATLVAKQDGADAPITLANSGNNFIGVVELTGSAIKLRDDVGGLTLGNIQASGKLDTVAKGGAIKFAPGTRQFAKGGMLLSPDPRPLSLDFPKVRTESLVSVATVVPVAMVSPKVVAAPAGRAALMVMATEQSAGTASGSDSAVIKISEAPLAQPVRNIIPVGKVIALDASSSGSRVIQSASFEIVDGFTSGATTIELGGEQAVPVSVDNDSGKVVLNGQGSVSDYDKAIQEIKLRVAGDVPPNAVFRIKITLTDQSGNTESKVVTLQVNQPELVSRNP